MEKTMSIYEAISAGTTVKNSAKARVNADKVGVDTFSAWKVAENNAFEAFYRYADERRKTAHSGENAKMNPEIVNNAFTALRNLLALVGEVNGHKIYANEAMLNTVAGVTMVYRKDLAGEALTQASIVKNLENEVKAIANGMNPDYVADLNARYEQAKIKLAELKKLAGSCTTNHVRVGKNKFYIDLETALATIVNEQDATPWEALEAAEQAREAERKAKRKANKNAKKATK